MLKTISFALKQIFPISFCYLFVGIAFGILMHHAGYSFLWTMTSAIFIYAGSMQIIMVSFMAAGMPIYMIALMTLLINGRHIFYGIGFIQRFRGMGWKYPYMTLTVTDEVYSIFCSSQYPNNLNRKNIDFTIAFLCHLLWIVSCMLGSLLSTFETFNLAGIEFSATAFFVTVCINQWQQFKTHLPAIIGLFNALFFYICLGPNHFILPALAGSALLLLLLRNNQNLKREVFTNGN